MLRSPASLIFVCIYDISTIPRNEALRRGVGTDTGPYAKPRSIHIVHIYMKYIDKPGISLDARGGRLLDAGHDPATECFVLNQQMLERYARRNGPWVRSADTKRETTMRKHLAGATFAVALVLCTCCGDTLFVPDVQNQRLNRFAPDVQYVVRMRIGGVELDDTGAVQLGTMP